MVRVKKQPIRNDLSKKAQPSKAKERNEEYLKYKKYLKSKEFKEVKKLVEERDGHKCMVCGRTRKDGINLTCHHRCYKHLYAGGEIEANDCITVCMICHSSIHANKKNYQWFSRNNKRNRPNDEDENYGDNSNQEI